MEKERGKGQQADARVTAIPVGSELFESMIRVHAQILGVSREEVLAEFDDKATKGKPAEKAP